MAKSIYTYYKERLIEIGGSNKCLYLKNVSKKNAYDIGHIFVGRDDKISEFSQFLLSPVRMPLTLISPDEYDDIAYCLQAQSKPKRSFDFGFRSESRGVLKTDYADSEDTAEEKTKKSKPIDKKRLIESEISKLKELKREIEEIEKETGRYELYIGYPFVFGSVSQGAARTLIKAPLLLFPVKIDIIDEGTVEISLNEAEKVQINRALIFAYAQSKKLNIDQLELDFDSFSDQFKSIRDVVDYLAGANIKIDCSSSKNIYSYTRFKEPDSRSELSVRYAAVLARFPISNSIYNDYSALEKKKLTNDAIDELLRTKKPKPQKKKRRQKPGADDNTYTVKMLDYAQSEVVRKVNENGNMVIYGPPGTGKSQTIVNIITDSICKGKRVLVVSQKKAALDVVYNRLGPLGEKAMYITDETREKRSFYERCLSAHQKDMIESLADVDAMSAEYDELQAKIDREEADLKTIFNVLNTKRPFGLSLSDMYSSSYMLSKNSQEYGIYLQLIEREDILGLSYKQMSDALFVIKTRNLEKLYYDFIQNKEKNPLIDHLQPNIDIHTISEVRGLLDDISKSRKGLFNIAKYPYYRQVLAYYDTISNKESLDAIVKLAAKIETGKTFTGEKGRIKDEFLATISAIEHFVSEYDCLHRVLTVDGYIAVIDNILRGNTAYIKLVHEALDNYISLRDVNNLLDSLDDNKLAILNFAYTASKNYSHYEYILEKLLEIRIYHEIIKYEEECKEQLSKMVDYPNITSRIYRLKEAQLAVSYKLCSSKNSREYDTLYETAKNNKDYLYQISKDQKLWPIRKTMEIYGNFILSLFPCWLLSPENVSNLLPLEKNLFDIVIFDEASQVFIESTIPSIYRGKNIVVAGDAKQLRPSTTFMKRYLGADPELQEDYSVQAALEVESLLDLAVARYDSANLTYHYRSRRSELIDFSNNAFYSTGLQIAPNISKDKNSRPIIRSKVRGVWIDRKNPTEAAEIVSILKDIFKTRKNNETIGIITFNSEQQSCIADAIDKASASDAEFRSAIIEETHRVEDGEDVSLFIKNLENVQGDERDIIIFSIGYAPNEAGKLYTNFGSLSSEGGENRLNVAITRAKSQIYVVTSIEPEDLKVENSKHEGPKLLKKYLMYVRAVSAGNSQEVSAILSELSPAEIRAASITQAPEVEDQIKARLEKLGYRVDTNLGNKNNRISLAIYDEEYDRYLVGVELDKHAFAASDSCLERDVYKPRFLYARGWSIVRVWCRDWWLYPSKVIKTITALAEKNKTRLKEQQAKKSK